MSQQLGALDNPAREPKFSSKQLHSSDPPVTPAGRSDALLHTCTHRHTYTHKVRCMHMNEYKMNLKSIQ